MSRPLTFLQSGRPGITLIIVLLGLLLAACGDSATPLSVGAVVTPTPNASPTAPNVAATNQATPAPTSATVASNGFKRENFLTLPQDEAVGDLAWSPDGKTLATTTASQIGTRVRLWNTSNGKEMALTSELQGVTALRWLPDGKMLTLGPAACNVGICDKKLRLWSDQGKLIADLAYSATYPFLSQLKPSPDNKTLAIGSDFNSADYKVWLWSLTDGKLLATLDKAWPTLEWSPDSKLLATSYLTIREPDQECKAKSGGTIVFNLWNPQGTLSTKACGPNSNYPLSGLAWSPDSEKLAISSEEATLVNKVATYSIVRVYGKDGQEKANFEASASFVTRLAWSPLPGKRVLALTVRRGCSDCIEYNNGSDGGTLDLWYDGAKPMIAIPNAAHELAWSPDGKMLAVAFFLPTESTGQGQMEINARYIKLFNEEGNLLTTLTAHEKSVTKLAWSPDGKTLASASEDKTVKLWR